MSKHLNTYNRNKFTKFKIMPILKVSDPGMSMRLYWESQLIVKFKQELNK